MREVLSRPVRTEALQTVARNLSVATRDNPVRILLEGERGTGKLTAINYGLSLYSNQQELLVLRGGPDQFRSPFSPLAEAFSGLLERNARNDRLLRTAADVTADLMRLVPFFSTLGGKIRDLYNAVVPDRAYPLNQTSDLIFRIQKVVRSISRHSHLVLVFSDFHQFDSSTLSILSQLVRLDSHSCSFLFTFDPFSLPQDPASDAPALLRFQSELLTGFDFVKVRFTSFSLEETGAFIDNQLGDGAATVQQVDSLYRRSGGNPLFLRELLSHLASEGHILDVSRRKVLADSYTEATLPESIKALIEARLARLSPELRSTIDFASVIGIEFRSQPLSEGLQLAQLLVLERLRRLERVHNLIQEMANTHRFSLEAIRDAVYESLGNALAREHHLTLARYFAQHPEYPDVDYLLFFHFSRAGLRDEAIGHLIRSAEIARSQLSHEEAAHRFRLARELREITPGRSAASLALLTLEEAAARYDAGQFAESATMLRALKSSNRDTSISGRILLDLALSEYLLDRPREANLLLSELLSTASNGLDEKSMLRALLTKSSVLYALGSWDLARSTFLSCTRELPKHDDIRVADVLKRVNMFYLPELAEHFLFEAKERLARQKDNPLFWEIHHNIGTNYLLKGELALASEYLQEALRQFESMGTYRVSYPLNNAGLIALLEGDHDVARTIFNKITALPVPQFDRLSARCHAALLDCLEGNPEKAIPLLETLYEEARHLSEVILWDIIGHDLAWAYRLAGRFRESVELLKASPPIPKDLWSDFRIERRRRMKSEMEQALDCKASDIGGNPHAPQVSGRSDAWRFKLLEFEVNDLWFWE